MALSSGGTLARAVFHSPPYTSGLPQTTASACQSNGKKDDIGLYAFNENKARLVLEKGEKPTPETVSDSKLEGVEYILRKNERLEKEIRGLRGMLARKKGEEAPIKPAEAEIKPEKAEVPEYVRPYEKFCPDCGGPNPNYVAPNLFCKDCGVPEGHIDKPEDASKVKMCWNCGSTKAVMKEIKA